jgi:hypothetical protein
MMNTMSGLIDNLKKSAIDRCRERIIEARGTKKAASTPTEHSRAKYGFTSKLKQMRGGLS